MISLKQLHRSLLLGCLVLLHTTEAKAQQPDFIFKNTSIKSGTKQQITIPVYTKTDTTSIPITIFHGKEKGPVLGITAGVHGLEYAPILAAQNLAKNLDPSVMKGTVILVHIANVPSFLKRSLRVNPIDGKNLNRVFPENENGSMTQKIAWIISNQVIARSDYFLDIHAGDANNDLRPYSGYYNYYDMPQVSEKAKQMALALGFDFVVKFGNTQTLQEEAIYCSREATKQHIPAVDIECGRMGIVEEKFLLTC